jgi:hypothetical protein
VTGRASSGGWAIDVEAVRPVSAGAIAWRSGGRWALTIVVKATFAIVDDGPAELVTPVPLRSSEQFAEGALSPSPPLVEEPDLAPYKPQVDVTFVGCVHAPRPVQALRARLAVYGEDGGIDRSLQAVGDRAGPGAAPVPFRQMPLGWDRTWASPDNPAGITPGSGRQPNVVDPASPSAAVGLGPIARAWPARARLLGAVDRRWIEGRMPEIPHDFRWEWFQAAPPGQRLARLRGAETILLENLLQDRPRVRTRLPAVRGCARLHAAWTGAEGQPLELVADTLAIDGEIASFSIVWRASVPLPRADASLDGARVVAGVELPGLPMPMPLSAPAPAPALAPPSAPGSGTMALSPEDAMRLLATAPRPVPFGGEGPPPARSIASTLRSAGTTGEIDPPTQPAMAIPIVAAPPPPPPEEATRQMSVGHLLGEHGASIDLGPHPGSHRPDRPPAAAPAGGSPTTMALTPEQASAMLAAAGRQLAASGGFPPPASHGAPSRPLPVPPPPVAVPPRAPGPPIDDDDVDSTGATFALTPEEAQRMVAEGAARKSRG